MKKLLFTALALCLVLGACNRSQSGTAIYVPEQNFQDQMDTIPVSLYTLNNGVIAMQVTNYGARVVSLYTADRNGKIDNILVGHDNLKDYVMNRGERSLGAIAGPVAGPISGGSFRLDGRTYQLDKNDGENTLDGGSMGSDKRPWRVMSQTDTSINMQLVLPDGDGGFPGKRVLVATYALSGCELIVLLRAFSSAHTPLSLSWRPWFNLHGEGEGTVEDHELSLLASSVLPINQENIPVGDRAPVQDTPFNFVEFRTLGDGLKELKGEYHHSWCITYDRNIPLHMAGMLRDPVSGRQVSILTNRPCVTVSTRSGFDGTVPGTNGKPIAKHGAVLMAVQDYPNAVNELKFPSVMVDKDGYFASTTLYRFDVMQ